MVTVSKEALADLKSYASEDQRRRGARTAFKPGNQAAALGPLWSRVADRCRGCGTRDRAHHGRGFCTRCFQRVEWRLRYGTDHVTSSRYKV